MKDIDFDELDRAVSSLLGKKDDTSKVTSAAAPTPAFSQPPTSPSQPAPAQNATAPTPSTPDSPSESESIRVTVATPKPERSSASSSVVPNRTGRFMDVVRPQPPQQADVTVDTPKEATLRQPVVPEHSNIEPEQVPERDFTQGPVPVSLGTVAQPDPSMLTPELDMDSEPTTDPMLKANELENDKEADEDIAVAELPTIPEPSPFLADAVVEKRPLGAFAEQPASPAEEESAPRAANDADDQLPADPTAQPVEKKLPPELNQSLVEVEATESGEESQPDTSPKQQPASAPATAAAPAQTLGAMSIPQQYKTAERPSSEKEAPIFDTTQYHSPLLLGESHHSNKGIWIAVIVLLLLAVGGLAYWYMILY